MDSRDLDFELPAGLIAQTPPQKRESARLLHYRRADQSIAHRTFSDLPSLLRPDDLLVFNDTKVTPARFLLRKPAGGAVDGLFLHEIAPGQWEVLLRNAGSAASQLLHFDGRPDIHVHIAQSKGQGRYVVRLAPPAAAMPLLEEVGRMPLPPYIKRQRGGDPRDELDRGRYQTVYARHPGAIAAPTAGLHFTPQLLEAIGSRGVERTFVTLHVGMGTFKPVSAGKLEDHIMHEERYHISPQAAEALNRAEAEHRRIIAVGTTSVRVLESHPAGQPFAPSAGQTGIFIHPPYQWKRVHSLITNFHLPRSTLIALVAAMVGIEQQKWIYDQAIRHRYRFFSYGDAMWVE